MTKNERTSHALMLLAFWPIFLKEYMKANDSFYNGPLPDGMTADEAFRLERDWDDDYHDWISELDVMFTVYDEIEAKVGHEALLRLEGNSHGATAKLDEAMIAYAWFDVFRQELDILTDRRTDGLSVEEAENFYDEEEEFYGWIRKFRIAIQDAFRVCDADYILPALELLEA